MNSDEDYFYKTETILDDLVLPSDIEQGPSGVKRKVEDDQQGNEKKRKLDDSSKDSILCQLLKTPTFSIPTTHAADESQTIWKSKYGCP